MAKHSYQKWLSGLLVFAVFAGFLTLIQFSTPDLVGTDGYYHIKFAYLMRTVSLIPDFPWLPLTILNPQDFVDHHFLFHVAQIPFTFGNLVSGAKWASVVFASLAFLSVWWLFRNQEIPFAGLWALGLLGISEAFLYRMNMPRAQALSLAILVLGFNFLLLRKIRYLLPLGFIYVWLYDGFPLIIILTIVTTLAFWVIEGDLDFKPLIFVCAGVILGLIINPYFPHNIIFLLRHLLPKFPDSSEVQVGNEWYPYETTQLLENSPFALILFLSGVFAIGFRNQRMDSRTAAALLMTMFFGVMLFQSRRFIEYFPPFVMIFAAMAWAPFIAKKNIWSVISQREPISTKIVINSLHTKTGKYWLVAGISGLLLTLSIWITTRDAQAHLQGTRAAGEYSQASSWLIENTPNQARVFQTDWDDFPRLFFYNTWNTYLVGLDPTYLQIQDADLYDLWVDITRGQVETPSRLISERFAAEYVFTDLNHEPFIQQAHKDPGMEPVYNDDQAIIFRVRLPGNE